MDLYWIWLSSIKYVGPVLQKALLNVFANPHVIYEASVEELEGVPGLNKRALESIVTSKSLVESEKILKDVEKYNIRLLRYDDAHYPSYARDCPESPALLYYKGDLRMISDAVAVVGSRRCTNYGRKVAQEIGRELGKRNVPLISGFAKGIDSYAQVSCVQNGGYTIGFLANGVDLCYPKEQKTLYQQMIDSGNLFISQYPPGTQPNFKYFLQRNALISAWSKAVVVVEAAESSGALWTAQFARKHERRIYSVPNQIGIAEGKGTNNLIAEGIATPYLGIGSLEWLNYAKIAQNESLQNDENQILTLLTESPKSIAEISSHFQESKERTLEELFTLELDGRIIIRGNVVSMK